jgi:hypothetical protein
LEKNPAFLEKNPDLLLMLSLDCHGLYTGSTCNKTAHSLFDLHHLAAAAGQLSLDM